MRTLEICGWNIGGGIRSKLWETDQGLRQADIIFIAELKTQIDLRSTCVRQLGDFILFQRSRKNREGGVAFLIRKSLIRSGMVKRSRVWDTDGAMVMEVHIKSDGNNRNIGLGNSFALIGMYLPPGNSGRKSQLERENIMPGLVNVIKHYVDGPNERHKNWEACVMGDTNARTADISDAKHIVDDDGKFTENSLYREPNDDRKENANRQWLMDCVATNVYLHMWVLNGRVFPNELTFSQNGGDSNCDCWLGTNGFIEHATGEVKQTNASDHCQIWMAITAVTTPNTNIHGGWERLHNVTACFVKCTVMSP